MIRLGYEQRKALQILRDTPDLELSALAKAADASWEELFQLGMMGLIDLGDERLSPQQFHPVLTAVGLLESNRPE